MQYKKSAIKIVSTAAITRSITIKYLNINTELYISDSLIYENLEIKTYTYDAKSILGYTNYDNTSQTITLTESTPKQTITFYYKQILGEVTVKYIDIYTNTEIVTTDIYSNLPLETYSYEAKILDNYTTNSTTTQSVTLSQTNTNQTLIFEYKLSENNNNNNN